MARIELKDALADDKLLQRYEPAEVDFIRFKEALKVLIENIDRESRESFNEDRVKELLQTTFYQSTNFVGKPIEGNIDLVILDDKSAKSAVRVIFEAKKVDVQEFPTVDGNINVKALHEAIYYYLQESLLGKHNKDVRRIVITEGIKWFIFDAQDFETLFAKNKELKRQIEDYKAGISAIKNTYDLYIKIGEIIVPIVDKLDYIYFDISKITNDKDLLIIYKILSPYYLLKKPCATDSNTLNKDFYNELLYIIGLCEKEIDGKKVIERLPEKERQSGSLIENAIVQLGYDSSHNLFDRAIQLVIIWINRILFLKLLEAQLVKWHNGDESYKFLTPEKLKEYDTLKKLFFGVLARRPKERDAELTKDFLNIPYLNSSLFEKTEELSIADLADDVLITVYKDNVLNLEKRTKINPLEYLLRFLDAYDFGSVKSENGCRKENKTLINASVLGLIFEKINGYKDGSYYTPGTITQYICRETLRRATVQKFNEKEKWKCETFEELTERVRSELLDKKLDRSKANEIINSLRICDPAVGSGHFLVSALNELIAIKAELHVLQQIDGSRLTYHIEVENDELIVRDEDGKLFVYKPDSKNPENQMVQESLSAEKQTIIENCLFGVDINPNSVNICRLRLWIELLKNAYYYTDSDGNYTLNTLPNIDINIKCGNSLISRYDFDIDVSQVLKKNELDDYKAKVRDYKSTNDKNIKHELVETINRLKANFKDSVQQSSSDFKKYVDNKGELLNLTAPVLFEPTAKAKDKIDKQIKKIKAAIAEYEEKQKNSIYENALEWRFEFPETLDDEGNFIGFDVVIGNPPFINAKKLKDSAPILKQYVVFDGTADLYTYFYELALKLCSNKGIMAYITSNKWIRSEYGRNLRKLFLQKNIIQLIDFGRNRLFSATVDSNIIVVKKDSPNNHPLIYYFDEGTEGTTLQEMLSNGQVEDVCLTEDAWLLKSGENDKIKTKIESHGTPLKDFGVTINRGILTGCNDAFHIDEEEKERLIQLDSNNATVIKPLIFGNDTKEKYTYNHSKYLLNVHNGLKGININPIDINDFPIIKSRLDNYYSLLNKRGDKGVTPYNLRNCAYLLEFEKEKIVWQAISKRAAFAYDSEGSYCDVTAYFMTGENLKYFLAILNSKLFEYALIKIYLEGDTFKTKNDIIQNFPISSADSTQQQQIIDLVDNILAAKMQDPQVGSELENKIIEWENQIDLLVYHLYGLTYDEAKMIDEKITEKDFAAAK